MRFNIILISALIFPPLVVSEKKNEMYYCEGSSSVGLFSGNKPQNANLWTHTTKTLDDEKYLVKKSKRPDLAWEVIHLDEDVYFPNYYCPQDGNLIRCSKFKPKSRTNVNHFTNGQIFLFNKIELKFLEASLNGILTPDGLSTLTVGKCREIKQ